MSQPLRIRLFGRAHLSHGSRALPPLPTQHARLLFSYLVMHAGRSFPRDVLAGTLWGERSDAAAKNALRTNLWRIQRGFRDVELSPGIWLSVSAAAVEFRADAPYWLDVEEFESSVTPLLEQHPDQVLDDEHATVLKNALGLYRGDFLEGHYDEWSLYEGHRLKALMLDALERLMDARERQGAWRSARVLAERLLHYDPSREQVHRAAMRYHYAEGNRPAALRQYRLCADLLERELGVPPMPETTALRDRIARGEPAPTRPTPSGPPGASVPPPSPSAGMRHIARELEGVASQLRRRAEELDVDHARPGGRPDVT